MRNFIKEAKEANEFYELLSLRALDSAAIYTARPVSGRPGRIDRAMDNLKVCRVLAVQRLECAQKLHDMRARVEDLENEIQHYDHPLATGGE